MSERVPPLHAKIRMEIEARIRDGRLGPGTRVPTEAELGREFGVSRITVQRALRDVAEAGLVVRYRGRGTFVAQTASEENLLRFTGLLTPGPEKHGDHRVVSAEVLPAGRAALSFPGLDGDEAVVQLERHKLGADDAVLNTELAVLPFRHAPDLLDRPLETLITHVYLRERGVELHRSRLYVEPHALTADQAALFGMPAGAPVFRWLRVTWTYAGEVVELMEAILPATAERFYVETNLGGP